MVTPEKKGGQKKENMGKDRGDFFLAFDLGASSGRALLGRLDDEGLAIEEVHRFPNLPVMARGTLYWDALGLYRELLTGLRLGRAKAGKLSGVGVDTWGVDFGLLDAAGRLIGNPVHYRDRRNQGVMEKVFATVPREKIFMTTGIQFLPFNTLYQLAAMRLERWPELERAKTLLMMPDLFNYFLCGRQVSEFTIATTTQFYNPRRGDWAWELLAALEVPTEILPEIVAPGQTLGTLEGEAAREGGEVPLIAPACHDTGSAVAAAPAQAGSGPWAYLSSGTWSILGIELTAPLISPQALAQNITNEGGVNGTYRFLKNIAGLWFLQECQRVWRMEDGTEHPFSELCAPAETVKPFSRFIDPDHPSFLHPEHMPRAIAAFCGKTGQAPPANRAETVRCILESLALKYAQVRQGLEEVSGKKIEVLHAVGGGSRNELLNQFTANALALPVLAGPHEATALGNLVVQAMAAGRLRDLGEARALVRKSFPPKEFAPQDAAAWAEAAPRFAKVIARGAECLPA